MRARILLATGIAVTATAVAAIAAGAQETPPGDGGSLAQVRRATAPYHDVAQARRDGYVALGACAALPGTGAMGVHLVHPQLAADGDVDPARPEVLLYEPDGDGGLRLVGVEWLVADADQDLATDGDRPSILGRSFDGPMPGHEPGMPVHYDLHAYLWRHNPAGTFAAWNPRVRCR